MPGLPPSSRRLLILAFGCAHLLYLAICVMPVDWRAKGLLGSFTGAWQALTFSSQRWNMFSTIPTLHAVEAHLLVTPPGQPARREGMLLPDLNPWPVPENERVYVWTAAVLLSDDRADQREPYMRRAAARLLAKGHSRDSTMTLVLNTEHTRSLKGVRALREISVPKQTAMGPFRLGDLAPPAAR
jgi:hypothetical protein